MTDKNADELAIMLVAYRLACDARALVREAMDLLRQMREAKAIGVAHVQPLNVDGHTSEAIH